MITILEKEYDGESIVDMDRDVVESLESDFNPVIRTLPKDQYGFAKGTFKVRIEWSE